MKQRLTALALATLLLLGLTACGKTVEEASPTPAEPTVSQPVESVPAESEAPESAAPTDSETSEPGQSAAPSETPSVQPSEAPSEASDPEPAKAPTANQVYAAVSAAAGVSYNNATSYIDAYYTTLDLSALDDYVFYMPDMSAQIEEIVIAKVSGDMDAVKSACLDRQKGMAEEAAFYGTTGAYVDSYQLVTEGDWVMFCVCEKSADAVSAFRSSVK